MTAPRNTSSMWLAKACSYMRASGVYGHPAKQSSATVATRCALRPKRRESPLARMVGSDRYNKSFEKLRRWQRAEVEQIFERLRGIVSDSPSEAHASLALKCLPRFSSGGAFASLAPSLAKQQWRPAGSASLADSMPPDDSFQVRRIREVIDATFKVEGDARREKAMNIKRLMDLGCYRGLRHRRGLPVRGQRTHTNSRTRKGPRRGAVRR